MHVNNSYKTFVSNRTGKLYSIRLLSSPDLNPAELDNAPYPLFLFSPYSDKQIIEGYCHTN